MERRDLVCGFYFASKAHTSVPLRPLFTREHTFYFPFTSLSSWSLSSIRLRCHPQGWIRWKVGAAQRILFAANLFAHRYRPLSCASSGQLTRGSSFLVPLPQLFLFLLRIRSGECLRFYPPRKTLVEFPTSNYLCFCFSDRRIFAMSSYLPSTSLKKPSDQARNSSRAEDTCCEFCSSTLKDLRSNLLLWFVLFCLLIFQ